jgi:hypothetical protein
MGHLSESVDLKGRIVANPTALSVRSRPDLHCGPRCAASFLGRFEADIVPTRTERLINGAGSVARALEKTSGCAPNRL